MELVNRIGSRVITIVLISVIIFFMFQIIPGDPVLSKLGSEEMENNPELAQKLYEEFNLDKPISYRFKIWVSGIFTGDFGRSFIYNSPVKDLIKDRFKVTLTLTVFAIILTVIIAIPMGFLNGAVEKRGLGLSLNIFSQLGLAIPSFWLAIMLIWLFAFKLGIFSTRTTIDWNYPLETLKSLVMPVIALSVGNISIIIRYLNNTISEEKTSEYVTLAKSKGLLNNKILRRHIFINTLIPVVTVLSMVLINLIMGSILVENVFNIQGIGSLLVGAVRDGDHPVSQAVILFYSVIVVLINLLTDFLYLLIDPRISFKKR